MCISKTSYPIASTALRIHQMGTAEELLGGELGSVADSRWWRAESGSLAWFGAGSIREKCISSNRSAQSSLRT